MIMVNVKQLMFDKGLNQSDLANIWGISQSLVSKVIRGERSMPAYYIDKLVEHFGEDVIQQYTIPDKPFEAIAQDATVTIISPETMEEIKEEIKEEVLKTTTVITPDVLSDPDIDIKAEYKAGNLEEYKKPVQDLLPENHITVYTHCDDMEPEIRSGEPVLAQLLPAGVAILPGRMYFVDLPSGGIIRYIEKEENGKLHLKARNKGYGDIVVHRDDVQSLSLVKLILHTPRAMSETDRTATELLVNRDRQFDRVLDQIDKAGDRERMLIEHLINKH